VKKPRKLRKPQMRKKKRNDAPAVKCGAKKH
jgi:hypothetical protein